MPRLVVRRAGVVGGHVDFLLVVIDVQKNGFVMEGFSLPWCVRGERPLCFRGRLFVFTAALVQATQGAGAKNTKVLFH